MAFPWDPSVPVHTASVRDGARVVGKLFQDPTLLPSGATLDVVTDFSSPNDMAQAITMAGSNTLQIQAYKGPWIFLKVIRWLAYEPNSIVIMGNFIETNWNMDIIPQTRRDSGVFEG